MQQVCVCRYCGKTVDIQFLYCPWCAGVLHPHIPVEEVINRAFAGMEEKDTGRRIEKIAQSLDILEKEITSVLQTMETNT